MSRKKTEHSQEFYQKKFNELQAYATAKGLPFPFRSVRALQSTWIANQEAGTKNIDKTIKYNMQYSMNFKSALSAYKMAKKYKKQMKLEDIKKLTTTEFAQMFQPEIENEYKNILKTTTAKKAGEFISQNWFGSK